MDDWISIATLAKYLLKALAMSDGLVIVSLLTVIVVGKVWLELFEDIISFIPLLLFTFFNSVDKRFLYCLYLIWASFFVFTKVFQFNKFRQKLVFNRYRLL